jgi:hypothetical protein
VLTNSATPTISGTTDAAAGTLITVEVEAQTLSAVVDGTTITESVGAQTLTAVVQPNGTWNVSPGVPLGQGVRTVTASVTDPAGNTTTATEQLTVDTIAPTAPAPTSPTPPTKSPTTSPTSPPSTSTPQPPKHVSVSSNTLTAQHPVKVSWTLAKPGTVELKLVEMVHGKTKAVGTVILKHRTAGKGNYTLTQRFAGHKLSKGSYKLSLQTTSGTHHSKPVTQKISVR